MRLVTLFSMTTGGSTRDNKFQCNSKVVVSCDNDGYSPQVLDLETASRNTNKVAGMTLSYFGMEEVHLLGHPFYASLHSKLLLMGLNMGSPRWRNYYTVLNQLIFLLKETYGYLKMKIFLTTARSFMISILVHRLNYVLKSWGCDHVGGFR